MYILITLLYICIASLLSSSNATPPTKTFHLIVEHNYQFFQSGPNITTTGLARDTLTINGTIPGPLLRFTEGDDVSIIVYNKLWRDTIALHFHGQHFDGNPAMDGSAGVTQCPILPGTTFEYRFTATHPGTYWYHSHSTAQALDGIYGVFIVDAKPGNDPYENEYDEEKIVVVSDLFSANSVAMFSDWYFHLNKIMFSKPAMFLLNGKGFYDTVSSTDFTFKQNARYRIRILNACLERSFNFSVDNHTFDVISADARDLKRIRNLDVVQVEVAQRIDIIMHANRDVQGYWLRIFRASMSVVSAEINVPVMYEGANLSMPPATHIIKLNQAAWLPLYNETTEGYPDSIRGYHDNVAPVNYDIEHHLEISVNKGMYYFNDKNFMMDSIAPPLIFSVHQNQSLPEEAGEVITLPYNKVIQLVIECQAMMSHPLHLHGHHMYILGSGGGRWDRNLSLLNTVDPPERDTIAIRGDMWLVVRFVSDNPGVWMFHCHIENHLMKGMGMIFIEAPEKLSGVFPPANFPTCGMVSEIPQNQKNTTEFNTPDFREMHTVIFWAPLCVLTVVMAVALLIALLKLWKNDVFKIFSKKNPYTGLSKHHDEQHPNSTELKAQ